MPEVFLAALVASLVSALATVRLASFLQRRSILDHPNERSSHLMPTPRGGGWAIWAGVAAGCLVLEPAATTILRAVPWIGGTALLMLVSWLDDVKRLPALPRLGIQALAVGLGLMRLEGHVFQGWLPPWLDYGMTALAWLWFVNLFNFMDGIDGLAGGEALAIAFGLFLLQPEHGMCLVVAAAVLGFLAWNWSPARIFMGDVGSVPMGYLLGAFLLRAAEDGHPVPALLLPLYFLVDATATLLRRLLKREKVWQAHRQHFYQVAVQGGRSHAQVATAAAIVNLALIPCAVWLAPARPALALAAGGLAVVALLVWMRRRVS